MAIQDNSPTFSYVKLDGISVTWNNEIYTVKDFATNKKYIYWSADIPNQLNASNTMPNRSTTQYLVLINDNGISTLVPMTDDSFSISFDGNSEKAIKEKIFGLYAKNEEFGNKFIALEQDIDGIRQIVGESGGDLSVVWDRISKLEQKSDEISISVQENKKEYNNDKESSGLREDINSSIIKINSTLGIFKSEITDYFKDNELSQEEKLKINEQIEILDNEKNNFDTNIDKVILLAEANGQAQDSIVLNSAKSSLNNIHQNLKSNIENAIIDNIITPTELTIIIDSFAKYSLKVNEVKTACDDIIILGLGGAITEELARIDVKSDEIKLSVSNVESSFKGEMSLQKIEFEKQLNDVSSSLSDFEKTVNTIFKDGIIDQAEKQILGERLANIEKEKSDVDARYLAIYNEEHLSSSLKEEVLDKYNDFNLKYNSLKDKINQVISDDVVNDAEKLEVSELFKEYSNAVNSFATAINKAIEDISVNKSKAELEKAKNELKSEIKDIEDSIEGIDKVLDGTFEDNILDEVERKDIEQSLESLDREKIDIDNIYSNLYSSDFLPSENKVSLKESYDNFVSAFNEVYRVSNNILQKETLIDDTDRLNLSNAIASYKEELNLFFEQANISSEVMENKKSESLKSEIKKDIDDVNSKLDDVIENMEDIVVDGILDEAEVKIIEEILNDLNKEKSDVDARYSVIYENDKLEGQAKDELLNAKTNFDNKIDALILIISNMVEDGVIDEEERSTFDVAREEFNTSSSELNVAFEIAIDFITENTVKEVQDTLGKEISDLSDAVLGLEDTMHGAFLDGVLSESEKISINQHLQVLSTEKSDIDKQYTAITSSEFLDGNMKTNLEDSYNNYVSSYNNLVSTIDAILKKDTIIDDLDRSALDVAFKNHNNKLGIYTENAIKSLDYIAQKKAEKESEKVDKKYAEIILDPETGIVSKVEHISDKVSGDGGLEQRMQSAEQKISPDGIAQTVKDSQLIKDIQSGISTNATNISSVSQRADSISWEVSQKVGTNSIISAINQTAESIKIYASKINLSGYVTFSELGYELSDYVTDYDLGRYGTTVIHGDRILTDTISVNHLKANNAHPIIKLFQHSGSGYCSLDATKLNEQGQGNAIRLKWDDNNYVRVADGNISFYMTGSNNNESALCSMYGGSSSFTLNTKGGTFSLNNGVYYNSVKLSQEGHSHSWSTITSKPSTFTPSSHGHSWSEITSKPSTFSPSWHDHKASHLEPANVIPASKNNYYCGNHASNWWYLVATNWIRYNGIAGGVYSLKGKTVDAIKDFFGNYSNITTHKNNTPISAYNDMVDYIYNEIYEENEEGVVFTEGATLASYQSQCLEILVNENIELNSKTEKLEEEVSNLKNEIESLKEIVYMLQNKQ